MMKINSQDDLRKAIAELQQRKADLELEIKGNFSSVKETATPLNLIKGTFGGFFKMPEFKRIAISAAVGFVVAFLIRKLKSFIAAAAVYRMVNNVVSNEFDRLSAEKPDSFLTRLLSSLQSFFRSTSPLYSIFGRFR